MGCTCARSGVFRGLSMHCIDTVHHVRSHKGVRHSTSNHVHPESAKDPFPMEILGKNMDITRSIGRHCGDIGHYRGFAQNVPRWTAERRRFAQTAQIASQSIANRSNTLRTAKKHYDMLHDMISTCPGWSRHGAASHIDPREPVHSRHDFRRHIQTLHTIK